MQMFTSPEFWIGVGQIIMIDILLGGDNAVVIALACRRLPPAQRTRGILWGTAGAIVLRIVLIFFALHLLAIPFLKIVGGLLLVWIGVKLLVPEHEDGHAKINGSDRLWGAVKTIIVADFVMSVDNVIAIAGAAESSGGDHGMVLVIFGVLVSIPIIVWGSQMVIKLMDRFPLIITLGGMLLGWIAGTMIVTDPVLADPALLPQFPKLETSAALRYGAGAFGALLVLAIGRFITARHARTATAAASEAAPAQAGGLHRMLLAVDGSATSDRAVRHVIDMRRDIAEPQRAVLHLVHVQRPVPRDVSSFVESKVLGEHYSERSDAALVSARALLDAAKVEYTAHSKIGDPGTTIANLAAAEGCGLIVMGTRGLGATTAAIIGSVAQGTLAHANVPVLLVK